jgi:hypothetical protein
MKFKEDDLQMATARYLDTMGLLWSHVANERKASPQAGARLKAKGVKSGVPDVLIFEPSGDYNGLAIELKIKPNKLSQSQKEWIRRLEISYWKTSVCYSIDEVIEEVKAYLRES